MIAAIVIAFVAGLVIGWLARKRATRNLWRLERRVRRAAMGERSKGSDI